MPRLRSPERHQQRPERRDPDLLSPGRASDYGRIAWLFGSRPGGITAVAFLLKESRVHGERPGGDAQSSWSVRAVSPSVQVERRSVTPGTRKDLGQMQTYLHHFLRSMPKLALLTCCRDTWHGRCPSTRLASRFVDSRATRHACQQPTWRPCGWPKFSLPKKGH
jgi:hypothetical protein